VNSGQGDAEPLARAYLNTGERPVRLDLYPHAKGGILKAVPAEAFSERTLPGWMPVRLATGTWSPVVAMMSGDGRLEAGRLDGGVLVTDISLIEDPCQVWTELAFHHRDRLLLQSGPVKARLLDVSSREELVFKVPSELSLDAVIPGSDGTSILAASGSRLYRMAPGEPASTELLLTFPGEEQILALAREGDTDLVRLWTVNGLYRFNALSGDHETLSSWPDNPVDRVWPLRSGPFALSLAKSGRLSMNRLRDSEVTGLFPALAPRDEGGMDSGYFGVLTASSGDWVHHRNLGWGHAFGAGGNGWMRFGSEGWLMVGEDFHPYLYSSDSGNWLFSLLPGYESPWVYDYQSGSWRIFGK
jgi:hypothetical protein